MLYIVDASVVAEFLITGTYTQNTEAFFKGVLTGDSFTVPELCLSECTNVIWQAVRFRGMPPVLAIQALRDLNSTSLEARAHQSCVRSCPRHWTKAQPRYL